MIIVKSTWVNCDGVCAGAYLFFDFCGYRFIVSGILFRSTFLQRQQQHHNTVLFLP